MKIAVISDIHGNLEALNAVLAKIDALDVRSIYCLGDIVGYGPNPNECVELIRSRNIPSVVGNHDKAVTGELSIDFFSQMAKAGVLWTQSVISSENVQFLKQLPYMKQEQNIVFVHSSPDYPEESVKKIFKNLIKKGSNGLRKAREAESEYIKNGNDGPSLWLKEVKQELCNSQQSK